MRRERLGSGEGRDIVTEPRSAASRRGGRGWLPHTIGGWSLVALTILILVVAMLAAAYAFLFNGSSAKPLTLAPVPTSTVPAATASTSAASRASTPEVLGSWSVIPGSLVGYRVREQLAFLPAQTDAVGRTSDVAGSITVAKNGKLSAVTAASFIADLRTLKSDRSMRDARIHTLGLQSDTYPTAGFKLTKPVVLTSAALHGQVVHFRGTGQLTIHGTTRLESIPITARLSSSRIETVGSITFPFTEFGMQAPNIAGFVGVQNHATMEFDLRFQRGVSSSNEALYRAIASATSTG